MRIAIPLFGTRVSPRVEYAQEILLVVEGERGDAGRQRIPIGHWRPQERADRLVGLGIDVLICGGIGGFLARRLTDAGVEVCAWVTGEAEHALRCFLRAQLKPGLMAGPRGPCGRWRFGQDRRRGRGRGRGPGMDW